MGSVGNQNPWAPYDTYKDCTQGICSIYCPQWCYIIFPPPPPFNLGGSDDGGDSGTDFSPLIIAIIGILASAFILVSYYTIISKYCRRRNNDEDSMTYEVSNESLQGAGNGGLDETLIKSITVRIYKKGDGFIEGMDCSVCLTEFQENDSLRLLPKCNHAFHLPCIDTWLKSHASCPLCRAHIASANILLAQAQQQLPPPPSPPTQEPPQPSNSPSMSALQHQYRMNEGIQDLERGGGQEEAVVGVVVGGGGDPDDRDTPKARIQDFGLSENVIEIRDDEEGGDGGGRIQPIRRSVSLNSSFLCQNQVSIADILRISEDDDDDDDDDANHQRRDLDKNRTGILNMVRSPLALRRSISAGRFIFSRYDKASRSSIIPN
eukprot:XP_025013979.1 RING-H2 finger protein ATL52 [Ricinus communis]